MEFPYKLPPEPPTAPRSTTLYPSLLPHSPAQFPLLSPPNPPHLNLPPNRLSGSAATLKRLHEPESPIEELPQLELAENGRLGQKRFKLAQLQHGKEFEPAFASLSLLAPPTPVPPATAPSPLLNPATLPRMGHAPLPITPPMQQGEQHSITPLNGASHYPLPLKLSSHQSYDTPYDTSHPSHPVQFDSPDFLGTVPIQQREIGTNSNEYGLAFGLGLIKDLSLSSPTPPAPRRLTRTDSPIYTTGKQKTKKKIKEIKMKTSYERAPGVIVVTSLDDSASSSSEPELEPEELEPIKGTELHPRMLLPPSPNKQSLLSLITPSLSNDILQEIMRGEGKRQEEMGLVLWRPLVLGKLAPTPTPTPSPASDSPVTKKSHDVEEEFIISELKADEMEVESEVPIPEPLIIDLDDEQDDIGREEGLSTVLEEELEQIKARGGVGVPDSVWSYGLGIDPVVGTRVGGFGVQAGGVGEQQEDEVMMDLD